MPSSVKFPHFPAVFPLGGNRLGPMKCLIYIGKKYLLLLFTSYFPVFPPPRLIVAYRPSPMETHGKTGKRENRPKFALEAAPLLGFPFSRHEREFRCKRENGACQAHQVPPREIGGIAAEWRDGGLRSAC